MKVLITCGGSGGHIFPGVALAQELKSKGFDILIACSQKPIDTQILNKSGFNFHTIPCKGLALSLNPYKMLRFLFFLTMGTIMSIRLLRKFRPDCVVGFGGYVSAPVIFAAWILRIPRMIHEQNLIPGLANRVEALFAGRIAISFEYTRRFFNQAKAIWTGNPIRGSFAVTDKRASREELRLVPDRFTIFVIGGSQGASFLNNTIINALSIMGAAEKKMLQIVHVTGRADYGHVKTRYKKEGIISCVFPFMDSIEYAYGASDLVIARAGATTIAELTYFGKPAFLVPYPKGRINQYENARFLSRNNAAITMNEDELDGLKMRELLSTFARYPNRLDEISSNAKRLGKPEATSLLAREVISLCGEECDAKE